MSERRFVLKEVPPTGAPHDFSITETELRKQFIEATQTIICDYNTGDMVNWYEVLPVLLRGDPDKPIILSRAEPVPVKDNTDWPSPEDIIKIRDKPAQPTRKDWEEWVEQMPENVYNPDEWERMMRYMKQWFLTMPGVPKE